MIREIFAKGNIPYYIRNHESPKNSVHISPFAVKHYSRSLVFLVLRLQLFSWLFHCSVSTLLHGFCRWVLFLTILSVHNSPWRFHFSAIIFNGKMLQAAATWMLYFLIFLGPNGFLVNKNQRKFKKKKKGGGVGEV